MLVSEAIEQFLIAREADGLVRPTLRWYRSLLKLYAQSHGAKRLESVMPTDLRQYINGVRRSTRYKEDTKHGAIRSVIAFWNWTSAEYRIDNPAQNIKYHKQPKPKGLKAAHYDDAARLLEFTNGPSLMSKRDHAIVALLVATGARAAGIVGLRMNDLDLERRRAYVVEKGDKERTVFFDHETQADIAAWIEARDHAVEWLFYNLRTKRQLTASGLPQIMYRLGELAGCEGRVNPHAWRHAFGISARQDRMDSINLAEIMGHEDVETTKRYARFDRDDELARIYDQSPPRRKIKRS